MKHKSLYFAFCILTFAVLICTGIPAAHAYDPMCEFYEEHNGACCSDCHDMVSCATTNLFCVPSPISTPNSGEKPVVYNSINSQVNGTQPYNGVCEVCHTQTRFHRNNASGDHIHYIDKKCTSCHLHGPTTMVSKGLCYTCHGGSPGDVPAGNPPMFASPIRGHAEAEGGDCDSCHGHDGESGTVTSHSTHTENDSDDIKGPYMTCSDCHNTNSYPDFADGATTLAATTACDNCHSPGGVFDGVAMAKDNWGDGIYEADGTALKSDKEQWCATCHDNAPAFSKQQLIDPFVVDNIDHGTSFEGSWGTSIWAPGYYGGNYHHHAAGGGTDTFTWTPTIITTAGTYKVWARWTTSGEEPDASRANDATYTIYHDGGSTPVTKDQQYNGRRWVSLGAYSFDGAGVEKVELGQSASGIVIADAIMFAAPDYIPEVLVDNTYPLDAIPNGDWNTSSYAPGYWGSDIHYHAAGEGTDKFTWTPTIATAKTYKVWARWTTSGEEPDASRANDATYTIYHDGGSTPVEKDQQYNGGEWVSLGTYSFDGAGDEKVELVQSANGLVVADAIVWCSPDESPPPKPGIYAPNVIGDNSTYGFYATGHGAHGLVECLSCHNARTEHIDHEHRTYASASDNYQAGYRLAKSLVVPRPHRGSPPSDYLYANLDDFALCADCHNLYEVLGEDIEEYDASHTNFYAHTPKGNIRNSHKYHINMTGLGFDSDWDGEVLDSSPTCIQCHNVHGPPNQAMMRHGELMSTYGTTDKVPGMDFCYLTSLSPDVCSTVAALNESVGSSITWASNQFAINGFCTSSCHGSKGIVRDPHLGPKVLNTEAYPEIVPADGTTEVLLTALVVDHNDNVPSNGVTIDLSPIDGVVETMYDDGINGGDLIEDDNIYSYKTTVPEAVSSGLKSLTVTATDPDGAGECNITLDVHAPGIIVLNNTMATYVGSWLSYSHSELFRNDGLYIEAGSGANTVTWRPTIRTAGDYKVYGWWIEGSQRATNAPYTIYYNGDSETVRVNQKELGSGGQWNLLGTYYFVTGTSGYVELSDGPDANGKVLADAIKLELQP